MSARRDVHGEGLRLRNARPVRKRAVPRLSLQNRGFRTSAAGSHGVGLPRDCCAARSLPEICGDAAIYVDPDAPADWIGALRRLADNADVRGFRRDEGLVRAAAFRWETSARSLLGVIEEVATAFDARAAVG